MQLPFRHRWCSASRPGRTSPAISELLVRALGFAMGALLAVWSMPPAQAQQHTHTFIADPELSDGNGVPYWDRPVTVCEEVMAINTAAILDNDTCTNQDGLCPYAWPFEIDDIVEEVSLEEANPGTNPGQLGHWEGYDFVAGAPFTHYKCPSQPRVANLLWKLIDIGREVENGQHLPVDGQVTMTSQPLEVWDITAPAKTPPVKVVLTEAIPATATVTLDASARAYWGWWLGAQLSGVTPADPPDPVSTRQLTVTTENNRPGEGSNGWLPDSVSSFGVQGVTALHEDWEHNSFADRTFLLFFPKNGRFNLNLAPNWYYYWSQTTATYGTHTYSDYTNNEYGETDMFGTVRIGRSAGGQHGLPEFEDYEGIDLFALICRHEDVHSRDYREWWNGQWYLFS